MVEKSYGVSMLLLVYVMLLSNGNVDKNCGFSWFNDGECDYVCNWGCIINILYIYIFCWMFKNKYWENGNNKKKLIFLI